MKMSKLSRYEVKMELGACISTRAATVISFYGTYNRFLVYVLWNFFYCTCIHPY